MLGIAPQPDLCLLSAIRCAVSLSEYFDCSAGIGAMVKKDFDHFGVSRICREHHRSPVR